MPTFSRACVLNGKKLVVYRTISTFEKLPFG
jgi:hypothetical protein